MAPISRCEPGVKVAWGERHRGRAKVAARGGIARNPVFVGDARDKIETELKRSTPVIPAEIVFCFCFSRDCIISIDRGCSADHEWVLGGFTPRCFVIFPLLDEKSNQSSSQHKRSEPVGFAEDFTPPSSRLALCLQAAMIDAVGKSIN